MPQAQQPQPHPVAPTASVAAAAAAAAASAAALEASLEAAGRAAEGQPQPALSSAAEGGGDGAGVKPFKEKGPPKSKTLPIKGLAPSYPLDSPQHAFYKELDRTWADQALLGSGQKLPLFGDKFFEPFEVWHKMMEVSQWLGFGQNICLL